MAEKDKSAKKPAPVPERPLRMCNPRKVEARLAAGWTVDKAYLGKTHRERVNIAKGDIVPMRAPK